MRTRQSDWCLHILLAGLAELPQLLALLTLKLQKILQESVRVLVRVRHRRPGSRTFVVLFFERKPNSRFIALVRDDRCVV